MGSMIEEMMADPGTRDIKEWLFRESEKPICLGELDEDQSVDLARNGYASGVLRMWAVDIDVDEDYENTGKILVELPADPAVRKQAVAWVEAAISGTGYTFRDEGEDIVFLMLD